MLNFRLFFQYLYLADNKLTQLPENFFDCLPSLVWLDLRRNYLVSLPSAYVSSHKCLRNILLQDNELRTLPLELGMVGFDLVCSIFMHNLE